MCSTGTYLRLLGYATGRDTEGAYLASSYFLKSKNDKEATEVED